MPAFTESISRYSENFINSIVYGGLATILCFLIGYPLAYGIAFRGGRYKPLLLFLVIAPFFTSFLIRTISWKILLGDEGPLLAPLKHVLHVLPGNFSILNTAVAQVAGLTYNFLPFMILPIYASLEQMDQRLIEAARDLYSSSRTAFLKVTLPISAPGVFAGVLLTFIPAVGDYVNASFLGSSQQAMIGNVIQSQYLVTQDYQTAAALSFVMMALIVAVVLVYIKFAGSESLMGEDRAL